VVAFLFTIALIRQQYLQCPGVNKNFPAFVIFFYLSSMQNKCFHALYIAAMLITIGTLLSCGKYAATNKVYKKQVKQYAKILREYPIKDSVSGSPQFVGTTNMSMRKPNFVIIHHTAQNSCEQTLTTFTLPRTQVSAHYVICKDGTVFHMLNDYLRAHHAGAARWGNNTDLNSSSIGIELDNNGFENFTEAQINGLTQLLKRLKNTFSIPTANFIGHGDIAPTRKNDPNWRFPWQQLSQSGFGLWYDDTSKINVPVNFNFMQALRIVGYDIRDSSAAVLAFRRHFMQDTTQSQLTDGTNKILYSLYKKN
jgi:N-acetylmuramoyl-L-alanine amidase